jgi:hypothetical protein
VGALEVSAANPLPVYAMKPQDHVPTVRNLGAPASEMNKREAMLAAILPALITQSPYVLWKRADLGGGVLGWDIDEAAVSDLIEDAENMVYLVLRRDE